MRSYHFAAEVTFKNLDKTQPTGQVDDAGKQERITKFKADKENRKKNRKT